MIFITARKRSEGYVFTGVCLSTGRGGELSRPRPRGRFGGLAGEVGCLRPDPGRGGGRGSGWRGLSRPRPRGEVGGFWLEGVQAHTWGGPGPEGCIPACTEADTPLQQTATAAGGRHPTGMHSCL